MYAASAKVTVPTARVSSSTSTVEPGSSRCGAKRSCEQPTSSHHASCSSVIRAPYARRDTADLMALSSGRSAVVAVRITPGFSRLGDEHGGAEDEPGCDDRADEARGGTSVDPRAVHHGMALAAGDEPAVDRHRGDEGDREREAQRTLEQPRSQTGLHGARDRDHDRV